MFYKGFSNTVLNHKLCNAIKIIQYDTWNEVESETQAFHPFSPSRFGRNKDELSPLSRHICSVVLKENIFTTKHCPEQVYRLSSPRRNGSNEILAGQRFPEASSGWGPALHSGLWCHAELSLGWGDDEVLCQGRPQVPNVVLRESRRVILPAGASSHSLNTSGTRPSPSHIIASTLQFLLTCTSSAV